MCKGSASASGGSGSAYMDRLGQYRHETASATAGADAILSAARESAGGSALWVKYGPDDVRTSRE